LNEVQKILKKSFLRAEELDFPTFVTPERQSTPLNATPYIGHLDDVRHGRILIKREELLATLIAAVDELREAGISPIAALLGGSAIGPKPLPSDLDCVLFYEMPVEPAVAIDLALFQLRYKARRLDLRLIPADGDPLLLIKATSFFTTLYLTEGEDQCEIVRGLVLLDCREQS